MKKPFYFIILFLAIINVSSLAQKSDALNGYKYMYVPTLNYNSGAHDIWGISASLRNYFSSKGFIVISDNTKFTTEIQNDPCLAAVCLVNHTNVSSFGSNKITITITNCKQETIYTNSGDGMGSSMQDDFDMALRKLFKKMSDLNYVFNPQLTPEIIYPKVETTSETESSLKNYFDTTKINVIEGIYKSYQSEGMGYYKFAIKKRDEKFIAIMIESGVKSWKPGEVKAVFEPSSMSGFYSVKWYGANKTSTETFGVMENDALLSIEFKEEGDEKKQDKFIKMYPIIENDKAPFKRSSGASGSGFFVSNSGLIATSAHVIEGAKRIQIILSNEIGSFTYKAKIVLNDSKNDIALIQIDDEKFKGLSSLPYGITEKADIGEKAFTIGYPLNDIMGTNYKVTDGLISAKSGIADDVRYYQISVPLQPGNSGGPLFNKAGNVIGITSARLNSKAVGTNIENVNYAIKATYLASLINMVPNVNFPAPSNQLVNKELKDQVKVLKNYVCLIQVD